MTRDELRAVLDFVGDVRAPVAQLLGDGRSDAAWNMLAFLMRRYLDGRLVTVTSLVAASGLPHATALRRIDELLARGLLTRRPRTRSGRSFAILPAPPLIERFHAVADTVKRLCGRTFGLAEDSGYYFGASYMAASIIPEPSPPRLPDGFAGPLRLLVNDEPIYLVLDRIRPQLEALAGVPLRLRIETLDRLREVTLRDARRQSPEFDIVAVDLPWIGEYAALGILLPLEELIMGARLNRLDFHPAGWEACSVRGLPLAIPLQPMPELLFCRSDRLAAAGLAPPRTTDEVLEAARRLTDAGRGQAGIAWNGARGTPVGQTFVQIMGAFGRPPLALRRVGDGFDLADLAGEALRPALDTAEARATLDFMRALLPWSVPEVLDAAWDTSIGAFAAGRAAMVYAWTDRAAGFVRRAPEPGAEVVALPHPRGPDGRNVAPVGGSALAIPARLAPARVAAAWTIVQWLTSPPIEKLLIRNGSLASARFSVSADPEVRAGRPVIGIVDDLARAGRLTSWQRPPVAEFAQLIAIIGGEIHDALGGRQAPAAALARAQSRIDTLMRQRGHY